jgi:hypothetical protein
MVVAAVLMESRWCSERPDAQHCEEYVLFDPSRAVPVFYFEYF